MNFKKWLLPCLALVLTACNQNPKLTNVAGAEQEKVARDYIQRLLTGDLPGLIAEADPSIRRPNSLEVFSQMRAVLPMGAPTVVSLASYASNRQPDGVLYTLGYQHGYRGQWFLITVTWRESPGTPRAIMGLQVTGMPRSIQEMTAFTFEKARPRHYAFAAAFVLVPAFMLVSLVTCIRMKALPGRAIWAILIGVGLVKFSLNWTSSAILMMLWSVVPLGVSAVKASDYSPWIISVSVPVGAMAFWVRRWWLLRARKKETGKSQI